MNMKRSRASQQSYSRRVARAGARAMSRWIAGAGVWLRERRALGFANEALGPAGKTPRSRLRRVQDPAVRARGVRRRMLISGCLLALFFSAVIWRAWDLQVVQRDRLMREAQANYMRTATLDSRRGELLGRDGEQLASSVQVDSVIADPARVAAAKDAAQKLARALSGLDAAVLEAKLGNPKSRFAYVKRWVTEGEADAVRALSLPGIELRKEWRRFYPRRELAGQVMGRVGVDGLGLEGVERALESVLRLREGEEQPDVPGIGVVKIPYVKDFRGHAAFLSGLPGDLAPEGLSAQLTIDSDIQAKAEEVMARGVAAHGGKSGMAVVLDVPTGEILALANVPTFNPNDLSSAPQQLWRNRAVKDVFEPGSTFKIFSLAPVLEAGATHLGEVIDTENGKMKVGKHTIRDTHRASSMTVTEVIAQSSNIGITKLTRRVGKKALFDSLQAFGFGEKTGVVFDAEPKGLVQPLSRWAEITFANVSFGQGIAVTALQLARATAALGNGGKLMRPILVKRVLSPEGRVVHEVQPEVARQAVKPETAKKILATMAACASPEGTGKNAMIPGFNVAGKTGTAQKAAVGGKGGYLEDAWISLFVGVVPLENPRLAIVVLVDEPEGRGFGGQVAAPLFREIAEAALKKLGIAPSQQRPLKTAQGSVQDTLKALATSTTELSGDSAHPIAAPSPGDNCEVPDLLGVTAGTAVRRAARAGFVVDLQGSGVVVHQGTRPNASASCGASIALKLEPAEARLLSAAPSAGRAP